MRQNWIPHSAAKKIDRLLFQNEHLQPVIWGYYYQPNKKCPTVQISQRSEELLVELKKNGIVKYPICFKEVAESLDQKFFPLLDSKMVNTPSFQSLDMGERGQRTGTCLGQLSFTNPLLENILFDSEICGLLYNYYQRQPYYRNRPVIGWNRPKTNITVNEQVSAKYHIDYYKQISLMLLINDLDVQTTHMQYALGSVKSSRKIWDRSLINEKEIENQYEILDCVGPKGTLYIFDAGNGYHRGKYFPGTERKFFHINVTTGHSMGHEGEVGLNEFTHKKDFPLHIKKMLDHLCEK